MKTRIYLLAAFLCASLASWPSTVKAVWPEYLASPEYAASLTDTFEQRYAKAAAAQFNFEKLSKEFWPDSVVFVSSHYASVIVPTGYEYPFDKRLATYQMALLALFEFQESEFFEMSVTDRSGTLKLQVQRSDSTMAATLAEMDANREKLRPVMEQVQANRKEAARILKRLDEQQRERRAAEGDGK
jgi:hypothetical protein